jgi:hypothetical protein
MRSDVWLPFAEVGLYLAVDLRSDSLDGGGHTFLKIDSGLESNVFEVLNFERVDSKIGVLQKPIDTQGFLFDEGSAFRCEHNDLLFSIINAHSITPQNMPRSNKQILIFMIILYAKHCCCIDFKKQMDVCSKLIILFTVIIRG